MRKRSGHISLKQSDYLYSNQRLKEAVDKVDTKYSTHLTGACGELVAYHVWSRSEMYGSGNGLNIITWGIIGNDDNHDGQAVGLKPPCTCTKVGIWGCFEFVSANDIIPIAIPKSAPSLTSLPTFEVLDHPGLNSVDLG
jgi:hypothetical protein